MTKELSLIKMHEFGNKLSLVPKPAEQFFPHRKALFKFFCCYANYNEKQEKINYQYLMRDHYAWEGVADALSNYNPSIYDPGEAWLYLLKKYGLLCRLDYFTDPVVMIEIKYFFSDAWGITLTKPYNEGAYNTLAASINGHFNQMYAELEINMYEAKC